MLDILMLEMLAMAGLSLQAIVYYVALAYFWTYLSLWMAQQYGPDDPSEFSTPDVGGYPLQTSNNGAPIAKLYGRNFVSGNVLALSPSVPFETAAYEPGGKAPGRITIIPTYTSYRRSFLIGICEGPAVILRIWKGNTPVPLSECTIFQGDNNAGIRALTGEDYGDWPNLCCVYFDQYNLGMNDNLPNFTYEVESGTGLEGKILIYDLAGLQAMNDDLTADYALMTDIDATPTEDWNDGLGFEPIGTVGGRAEFVGTLDGRNHTIDGLFIDRFATPVGLFSYLGRSGSAAGHISNLKLTNCDISGVNNVGMMAGVTNEGSTCTDCYVEGILSSNGQNVGGFFGHCYDDVFTRCAAVGSITIEPLNDSPFIGGFGGLADNGATATDCYARVTIAGGPHGGMETGCFWGKDDEFNTLTRCYAAASIQYSNSSYTYSYDTRPWPYQGGGFFGSPAVNSTYSSCYWDTEEGASIYPDAAKAASGYKNERQSHDLDGDPTGGHFHISHDGNTTDEIAWDANEATVQAACDADFGANEVDIEFSGADKWNDGGVLKVMFYGPTYGLSPQADLTFDLTDLLPGGLTVTSTDDVTGVAPLVDAGITGKTTAQMQTESTFDGWDFDTVWKMGDSGYPELRMQDLDGCDMNAADIVEDVITNDRYGGGRDSGYIDAVPFASCREYWDAQNMRISIAINECKPWQDWVMYILSHCLGYGFESNGKYKIGALRDTAAVFEFDTDDILIEDRSDPPPPVQIIKRPYSDTFNRIELIWTDKTKDYARSVAIAQDESDQRLTGVRKRSIKLTGITTAELAQRIAYRLLFENMYRFSVFSFKVGYKNMLVEMGDVGTITDGQLLTNQKIRIMRIEEEKDGKDLKIEAVEDTAALYQEFEYTTQQSDYEPDPDITLADGTVTFREDTSLPAVHLSITPGNEDVRGFYIATSYDDVTYVYAGKATLTGVDSGLANSRGTVSGSLPAHGSMTWAKDESVLVSIGTVTDLRTDVTEDEFWHDRYLAKIDSEIIAFKDAVETATEGVWLISNLRRGLFGTEPVAHSAGESFATLRVDYSHYYPPTDIGQTMYFKVMAYYGPETQEPSDVTGSSVKIQGHYQRPAAASLLRLSADENDGGSGEYSGASFTLYWNLGSRVSGWNVGGWDVSGGGAPWNNYTADDDLEAVVLKFEETDGTPIDQREIAVDESATITKATDLGGLDNAVIRVVPRRVLEARLQNPITVTAV